MRLTFTGALALLLLAGCAGTSPSADTETWTTYSADVTDVRPGPDASSAVLVVKLQGGHPDCYRDLRVTNFEETEKSVHGTVVFDSKRAGIVGGCPEPVEQTITVTALQPIGERTLGFGLEAGWIRDGAGFRKCHPSLGCHPPAEPCHPDWIRFVRDSRDVPRNSSYDVDFCDPRWLVITVNLNSTVCGAEPRPGCAAEPRLHRYFLRWTGDHWQEAALGTCPADMPKSICDQIRPLS